MMGIDLDNKVFCRNCNEYFIKGTGHLLLCVDCQAQGKKGLHPVCDPCYIKLVSDGTIKKATYNKKELSPGLMERLR